MRGPDVGPVADWPSEEEHPAPMRTESKSREVNFTFLNLDIICWSDPSVSLRERGGWKTRLCLRRNSKVWHTKIKYAQAFFYCSWLWQSTSADKKTFLASLLGIPPNGPACKILVSFSLIRSAPRHGSENHCESQRLIES